MRIDESVIPPAEILCRYLNQLTEFRRTAMPQPEGFHFLCIEHFVLEEGTNADPRQPLTEDERQTVRRASAGRTHKMKECFYNAQLLALDDPTRQIQYVEGYACGAAGLPVHHGWAEINGKVVDLTWTPDNPVLGAVPEGWAYRGVSFDTGVVRRRIVASGEARAFIGDWTRDFPLLRGFGKHSSLVDDSNMRGA